MTLLDLMDAIAEPITPTLPQELQKALQGRGWVHRLRLSVELGVSVRAIRQAASESHGAILSANSGLKLTSEATEDEVQECLGRFTSQIHEMSRRVCEIRDVFEACRLDAATSIAAQTSVGVGETTARRQ